MVFTHVVNEFGEVHDFADTFVLGDTVDASCSCHQTGNEPQHGEKDV